MEVDPLCQVATRFAVAHIMNNTEFLINHQHICLVVSSRGRTLHCGSSDCKQCCKNEGSIPSTATSNIYFLHFDQRKINRGR